MVRRCHGLPWFSIDNRSGNTADFLYRNSITEDAVPAEIKTPATPLLGQKYRNNVVDVSSNLTGGQLHIMNARPSMTEEFSSLMSDEGAHRRPLSPRGLPIVGSSGQPRDHAHQASFEMFPNNQRDIVIVTFDELQEKIELLMNVAK